MHILSPYICIYYNKKYADTDCFSAYFFCFFIHFLSLDRTSCPFSDQITGRILKNHENALKGEIRNKLARRIEEVSRGCAQTFGGDIAFEMKWGTQPLINDAGMAAFAADSAAKVVGSEKVLTQMKHPLMGSDDFSCYLEVAPGAYLFLSSSNPEKGTDIDHHSCRFNIDEDVLREGTAVFSQIAEEFLA